MRLKTTQYVHDSVANTTWSLIKLLDGKMDMGVFFSSSLTQRSQIEKIVFVWIVDPKA
jgi:hypothetical protein